MGLLRANGCRPQRLYAEAGTASSNGVKHSQPPPLSLSPQRPPPRLPPTPLTGRALPRAVRPGHGVPLGGHSAASRAEMFSCLSAGPTLVRLCWNLTLGMKTILLCVCVWEVSRSGKGGQCSETWNAAWHRRPFLLAITGGHVSSRKLGLRNRWVELFSAARLKVLLSPRTFC